MQTAPSRRGPGIRLVAWLVLVLAGGAAAGVLSLPSPTAATAAANISDDYDSTVVAEALAALPDTGTSTAVLVVDRTDGAALTGTDTSAVTAAAAGWATSIGTTPTIPLQLSEDSTVGVVTLVVPLEAEADDSDQATALTDALRAEVSTTTPDGLRVQVTGPLAIQADLASVFAGADFTLLAVTVCVVAVLLLVTYRSPVLWIVPLLVVGGAEQVTTALAEQATSALGLVSDGSVTGITSVLVFGAATDYALLLISRYREELMRVQDVPAAMVHALRRTAEAVLASGGTVTVALLTLLLSDRDSLRAIGLSCAIGVVLAVLASLVVLPAALAVCGRWLFWPFVPRFEPDPALRPATGAGWRRIGLAVAARPAAVAAASLVLLVVLSAGSVGLRTGLSTSEQFRDTPESIQASQTLSSAFPAGQISPATVVTTPDAVDQVVTAVSAVEGVDSATAGLVSGDLAVVQVVLVPEPGSAASNAALQEMRDALSGVPGPDATGGRALVGGDVAESYDEDLADTHDQKVILPLILLIVGVVLVLLLRSLLGPLVLVVTVVASFFAAYGGSWVITHHLLGFPALDSQVLLLSFLFLVALGVDYNIFLVARAREEARTRGTREGMVEALSATGGVITSAGVLLAAVFAVLGVLPLITLTQIGVIVCVGVLLDALLVRTVLVPAVVFLLGDRFWWPARPRPTTPAGSDHDGGHGTTSPTDEVTEPAVG